MPSRTPWSGILCLSIACCVLCACGKANDSAPALSSNAQHPAAWLTDHRSAYRHNPDQCRECHGADLKGGITRIDCFNQAALGQCHAAGHGPREIIHAIPFKDKNLHGPMARKDLTICRDCHGTSAANNPRFNVVYGSLPAGCESSGCHLIRTAHPKPWNNHGAAGNQANACALCHGTTYGGGTGPACSSCHTLLVAGTIPSAGRCDSCHGNSPTGGNSGTFSGSHAAHLALPELKSNCAACHSGGGSNSAVHLAYNNARPAVIGVSAAFTPRSGGVPAFNAAAATCSNVSCHGGLATPVWGTRISSDCAACHASGTAQYNSYHSGRHDSHISQGVACTDCHDTSKLASGHFSNLSSATLNQAASGTLRSYLTYNPVVGPPTCSPAARPADTQFSAPSCHGTLGVNQQKWQ